MPAPKPSTGAGLRAAAPSFTPTSWPPICWRYDALVGNPAFNFGDGGACWECEHFRGLRTQPDGTLWTLCGQGMLTFKFVRLPPANGCRYWTAVDGEAGPAAVRQSPETDGRG